MSLSAMAKQRDPNSFVARIRLERETSGNPIWRGHIRHVQGEQETYFQDLAEMKEFLERVSGVAGPSPAAASAASPLLGIPTAPCGPNFPTCAKSFGTITPRN